MTIQPALRPMLPTDPPLLAALFQASIAVLAEDDYDEAQRDAWAARADDAASFGEALGAGLTLVATSGGKPVGFATLNGESIAMLHVAPDSSRQGIGSLLLDALVRIATARGSTKLTTDASDTARDFFAARGFTSTMRNTVPLGEQWLGNTTMEHKLAAPAAGKPH